MKIFSTIMFVLLLAALLIPGGRRSFAQDRPLEAGQSPEEPSKAQLLRERSLSPSGAASTSLPLKMSYQGLLTTSGGAFVPNGSYDLTVELYDSLAGGTQQWTETHAGVVVQKGTFGITLGAGTPLNLQFNKPLFLQLTATGGPAGPSYPLNFSPRSELTSAPYSLAPWVTQDSNIYYNNGAVGLGTSTPGSNGIAAVKLEIADENGLASDLAMRAAGGGYPVLNMMSTLGTLSAPAPQNVNFPIAQLRFGSWDGSIYRGGAHIIAYVDSTPSVGSIPSRLTFWTQQAGTSGAYERMRLDRNGRLGIGTTNPVQLLSVAGNIDLGGGIYKGTTRFLHGQGVNGFFGGLAAGAQSSDLVGSGNNTGLGTLALSSNTTGAYNTAVGSLALWVNVSGYGNVATGYSALGNNTGSLNCASGYYSLAGNSSGSYNTAGGSFSLYSNTTGVYNTAFGYNSLSLNGANSANTAVGFYALASTSASDYNTAVGANAGRYYNNGWNNVFVGANTDVNDNGYYNVIAIGQGTIVGGSSTARFGNAATVSYGGWAGWTNVSDGRFKKNVKEDVPGLAFITKLRPVTYNFDAAGMDAYLHRNDGAAASKGTQDHAAGAAKGTEDNTTSAAAAELNRRALLEKEKVVYTGFVAQEVEAAARELGFDFSGVDAPKNDGDYYGLRYAEFVVPLVKAVQEQQKHIEEQDRLIRDLQNTLASMTAGGGARAGASTKDIKQP